MTNVLAYYTGFCGIVIRYYKEQSIVIGVRGVKSENSLASDQVSIENMHQCQIL